MNVPVHPDEREMVESELPHYVDEKRGWGRTLVRWRHGDGSYRFLEGSTVPILDGLGEIAGWRGIARDVTESRRLQEALRVSQQVTEGILDAIPTRVFWKDRNLVYLGCNAVFARDAGFAATSEVIGKDDFMMGWRDQAELYRSDDRQVIESGCSKHLLEEPQTTPDGKTIGTLVG